MSTYNLEIPEIGQIKVTKKRGMRSMRLRISPKGEILVSTPWNIPRNIIYGFINDRREWIVKNTLDTAIPLQDGMIFGNNTKLQIIEGSGRKHSSVGSSGFKIKLDGKFDLADTTQQKYIEKKVIEAMQTEAENILLPRLHYLAQSTNHSFNQAYVKRLSSRWGSCDSKKNITLNVFLLQLPEVLQDYVIFHELSHTKYMNHSPEFWLHMDSLISNVKIHRKQIKVHRPRIEPRF